MSYIVTLVHNGVKVPLRGTVWAFSMDRATQHATREAAQAALDKARKFMKAAHYKAARIEEVEGSPFVLSYETDAGTRTYGFHLGSVMSVARECAEEHFAKRLPSSIIPEATRIITVALMRDGKMFDCYDGKNWMSDAASAMYDAE